MKAALTGALRVAIEAVGLPVPSEFVLDRPANAEHGDWSSNVALVLAKAARKAPREVAEDVRSALTLPAHVVAVEVAGPGFLNFRLAPSWRRAALEAAMEPSFGFHDWGAGRRVQVEFVSANPTGPLHVGHGRWAAYGDSLARLLEATGHTVTREFYVNDTGGQIHRLGESLLARKRGSDIPDDGYPGEYVADLAKEYQGPDEAMEAGSWAAGRVLENIRETCDTLGVHFDVWSSQAAYEAGEAVYSTIALLRQRNMVYDEHAAAWLRSTSLGDSRDRVLVTSDKRLTYLAGDLAYHRDKFLVRSFDSVIDVFGADHHGQVASLLAGVEALGVEHGRLEIIIGQLVSLVRGRLSRRAGNVVDLADLLAEIGPDSARFLFLVSSIDQAASIDVEKAVKQDLENPVYYVQMAHARVCSIAARAKERGVPLAHGDPATLEDDRVDEIAHLVSAFPDVVDDATRQRAPHKLATWCRKLAGEVHGYYHRYPVLPADPPVRDARFAVLDAARAVLGRGLSLLGVSAPEEMAKLEP